MGQSKITVRPDRVTGQLGDLYGIFFEDLNHAADGGLYYLHKEPVSVVKY